MRISWLPNRLPKSFDAELPIIAVRRRWMKRCCGQRPAVTNLPLIELARGRKPRPPQHCTRRSLSQAKVLLARCRRLTCHLTVISLFFRLTPWQAF